MTKVCQVSNWNLSNTTKCHQIQSKDVINLVIPKPVANLKLLFNIFGQFIEENRMHNWSFRCDQLC
jgi:hypothetical protein